MPEINIGINAAGAIRGAKQVNRALGSIGSRASSMISTVFNPLNAAIASVVSVGTITGLAKVADKYTVMASQLEYVTGSAKDATAVQAELYEISRATGTQIGDNAGTFVKLQQASAMTNLSMGENLAVIEGLNALMVKTGTSGAQASSAMLQLSQALTSGKLSGDEFRSMAENAPGVLNEMSNAMGIARSDLKEMSTQGELTSERLGKALLSIAYDAQESMDEMPQTVAQGWNAVVLAFERAWVQINGETGIMSYFRNVLLDFADWMEDNTEVVENWAWSIIDSLIAVWPDVKEFFTSFWAVLGKTVAFYQENKVAFASWANYVIQISAFLMKALGPIMTMLNNIIMAAAGALAATARVAGAVIYDPGISMGDVIDEAKDAYNDPFLQGNKGSTTINVNQPMTKTQISDVAIDIDRQAYQQ